MQKPPDWDKIRREYESGLTVARVAARNQIKSTAIRQRAEAESWGPNQAEAEIAAEQERKQEAIRKRAAASGALAALSPDDRAAMQQTLLARYVRGEMPLEMAQGMGASRFAVYHALLGGSDDELHGGLVTEALISRIARADAMLEAAQGPYEIARARELAKFARMDFERRRPRLYGLQARVDHRHTVNLDLGERLRRARARVIEATVDSEEGDESGK